MRFLSILFFNKLNLLALSLNIPSPIHKIPIAGRPDLTFYIKRDDLIHSIISGNKWRKLQWIANNLPERILTFGGAFSNHIVATAAFCQYYDINSTAYIRTDKIDISNPTLKYCKEMGMELIPLDRTSYKSKTDLDYLDQLQTKHPKALIIPEGGSSIEAINGICELIAEIKEQQINADYIITSFGSGATSCGILAAIDLSTELWIMPAIKGLTDEKFQEVNNLFSFSTKKENYKIIYHSRNLNYAKKDLELFCFIESYFEETGILLDPIYNGKAMYTLYEILDDIPKGKSIVFIHTGGIQAWKGYFYRFPKLKTAIPIIYKHIIGV